MAEFERKKADGKDPDKPWFAFPSFLTFIRPPYVGSFRILAKGQEAPIDLLAVSAHLLFGENEDERLWEFLELIEWLALRAKYPDRLYAPNLFLLGDCNLFTRDLRKSVLAEFAAAGEPPDEALTSSRDFFEWKIKSINRTKLRSRKPAKANFPLLDVHPVQGVLRTSARQGETYDQIGIFRRDERLPLHDANAAVTGEGDTYDFGVFRFTDLIAEALMPDAWARAVEAEEEARQQKGKTPESPFLQLPKSRRDRLINAIEFDVSDHLPAWMRLPIPGA